MVQYYRDTRPIISHVLNPLVEADRGPELKKLWNEALESYFKQLNIIVSDETLLFYSY